MRYYKKHLLTTLLCLFLIDHSFAQIPIFEYTQTAPTIDGSEDTPWNIQQAEDIAINNQGTISSSADLNGSFKFIWDDNNLYVLVVVNDNVNHSDDEASIYLDDGIEIYLDMQNEKAATYDNNDYQYAFRYLDNTIHEATGQSKAGIIFDQNKVGNTITYEIQFPWSTLGIASPTENMQFGLDIHLNDDDNNGSRDGKLAWFTSEDNSWRYPYLFGTAQLGIKQILPLLGTAQTPSFSHKRGFYTSPFTLTLTDSEVGATINYTLDGSDPRTSSTSLSGTSPISITIDPSSITHRGGLTPGVAVRAHGSKPQYANSDVETHSYIFLDDVETQSDPNGVWPNPYRAEWGFTEPQSIDYDMDADVINDPKYTGLIDDALLQIPTISIVTDNDHIFDETTGIYMNALQQGWERPTSVELINPDQSEGFQVEAGLRVRGGYSRIPSNPRHSFRLFFRSEYGDSKLNFPLFGNEGTDKFDKIDLRTAQNYSWSKEGSEQNTFLKDIGFRDIQGAMGQPYSRSVYYHLYLNGVYWGLYMTEERPEARFAEDYLGGDNLDYDVVKPEREITNPTNDLKIAATDGTTAAAERLWTKVIAGFTTPQDYYEIQGMNVDGTRNPNYERLLDIDNLIDYLHIAYYAGSYDAPISAWSSNPLRPNNFFAIYNRNSPDGFKWFVHDFEHSMNTQANHDMVGAVDESWLIDRALWEFSDDFLFFNPIRIHLELMQNEEYKMKFSDRVHKNFTTGGYLYPDSIQSIFDKRQAQIDLAIIAESARWGDTESSPAKTKDDWLNYINVLRNDYIPYRTDAVVQQFIDKGWYPSLTAPSFTKNGSLLYTESITSLLGEQITISNTNGTTGNIYYTIDGTDPRTVGGAINTTAILGNDNITHTINSSIVLKSRIYDGSDWSPIKEILITIDDPLTDLKITEIHYNPLDINTIDGGNYEFIELKNTGNTTINLTGVSITNGIVYTFGAKTLAPGQFIVLASSVNQFNSLHGFIPDGQFLGGLKNSGEKITISNATGTEILSVTYDDQAPWPIAADGLGNSLVPINPNPNENMNLANNWRASSFLNGSPGQDDPQTTTPTVVISEVLSHSDIPYRDAIELYNYGNNNADISNWFLTDDKGTPKKWQIPTGTIIPPNSFLTFYEGHYVDTVLAFDTNEFGNAFSISSHGEEIFLISALVDSSFTGYSTGVTFDEIETNTSFGRYVTSVGDIHFVAQTAITLDQQNATPRVGPIIFNQVMYNPVAGNYEYIELKNTSNSIVSFNADDTDLNTWKISGAGFTFPSNITLAPNTSLYVIQANVPTAEFRAVNNLASNIQVFNMSGTLSNDGETLELKKPGNEYLDGLVRKFDYILIEAITYNDKAPWTIDADSNGYALVRIDELAYGNDVINWNNGIQSAPTLIADNLDNEVGNTIDLTFSDDANWRSAITSITIDGLPINPTDYNIQPGNITLNSSLFLIQDTYSIEIVAPMYDTASVSQIITGNPLAINNDYLQNNILISPNPSVGNIQIIIDSKYLTHHFEIVNLQGQMVAQDIITQNNFEIDMSQYANGMYLLIVSHSEDPITKKILKK